MKKPDWQLRLQDGLLLCTAIFALLLLVVVETKAADPSADYPSRPIECAVHTAPGSGVDVMWRLIGDIIQKEKLLSQPMVVINKTGGGGAVAFSYVLERKGNPHIILSTSSTTFLITPMLEKLPYDYKSFTSLANFAVDGNVLMVKGDSPFKTVGDLIAEAKKRPNELRQGAGNYGGSDGMLYEAMQKAAGAQWNFLSFAGGSPETLLSVLNGTVDFAIINPSIMIDHARTGKVRVLLAAAPNRYSLFKDAPTMQEAGLGVPIVTYRGCVGAPNMPDYAARKIEAVLKRVAETDRFKKFVAESYMQPAWMSSGEWNKFLGEENNRVRGWISLMKK